MLRDESMNKIAANLTLGLDTLTQQLSMVDDMFKQHSTAWQKQLSNIKSTEVPEEDLSARVKASKLAERQMIDNAIKSDRELLMVAKKGSMDRIVAAAKEEEQRNTLKKKGLIEREALMKTESALLSKQLAEEKLLYMQARRTAFEAQSTGFGGLLERRTSWLVSGAAVFGGLSGLTEAVSTIKDVEFGMTTIARITEDVNFDFNQMRDSLQDLGVEFGMIWDNVSDIAIRWAQAGYDVEETLELTRSSLLALNTAELDAQYATQGLIAIMAQWGLEADQLLPVIDKINLTADDWAVSSQDLVDGLNRSSGAAKVMGMTLEETIAVLTVMREATGRTGREVGNALNSILSFMQRDVAIKAFSAEGIAIWADESQTQFRNVIDIMDDVASRWQTMGDASRDMFMQAAEEAGLYSEEMAEVIGMEEEFNDIQQRNLSSAMAGIYRRNYLLALLQNWSKVDQVLIGMEDSLGYSMRENERTMNTLTKQIESLKAAAESFAVAIGDAGLLDQMTALVEGTTSAIEWFNNLDSTTKRVIVTFTEVTLAIKGLSAMLGMLGIMSNVGFATGGAVTAKSMTRETQGLTNAIKAALTNAKNLGPALLAAFGGPWMLGITAAATAIYVLVKRMQELKKAEEELVKNVNIQEAQVGQLESLQREYESLSSKVGMSADEHQRLAEVVAEIGAVFPEAVSAMDSEGEAMALNNEILKESIKLRKEELELSRAKIASTFENFEGSQLWKNIQKDQREIEAVRERMKQEEEAWIKFQQMHKDNQDLNWEALAKEQISYTNRLRIEINELERLNLKNIKLFDDMALAALNTDQKMRELNDNIKLVLITGIREAQGVSVETAKAISGMVDTDIANKINSMSKSLDSFKQTADFKALNASFQTFKESMIDIGQTMGITDEAAVQMAYAVMGTIDPVDAAQLKLWQLDEVINLVGENSMVNAVLAAKASEILATNVSAATAKTIAAHMQEIKAVRDKAEAYNILARAVYAEETQGGKTSGMGGTSFKIAERTKEYKGYLDAMYALDDLIKNGGTIAAGNSNSYIGGGGSSGASAAKEAGISYADTYKSAMGILVAANEELERSLSAVDRTLSELGAEYDYLADKINAGKATMADFVRREEIVVQKTDELNDKQNLLTKTNIQYSSTISSLNSMLQKAAADYEKFKAAGDTKQMEEATSVVKDLTSEIDNLSSAISSNTAQIWNNKTAISELSSALYAAYYQDMMNYAAHMEAMNLISTQQQYELFSAIDTTQLKLQEQWQLEERQYNLRLKRLQEERDQIKSAYDDRMRLYEREIDYNNQLIKQKEAQIDAINEATNAQIEAIERLMDALDDEGETESREEAERKHNQKIADLLEERLYHELRTGIEHQDAIADIDRQIAEENRDWELQKNKWSRDNQKKAYQDQIDSLKKQASTQESFIRSEIDELKSSNDEKKTLLQEYYTEVERLFNDSHLRMAAINDELTSKVISNMDKVANSILSGSLDTNNITSQEQLNRILEAEAAQKSASAVGAAPSAPSSSSTSSSAKLKATFSSGSFINENGTTYAPSRDVASALGVSVDWNQATGKVIIGGKSFTPWKIINDRAYVGIRQVAEALGYNVDYDPSKNMVSILYKAHQGAFMRKGGLLEVAEGERVLSPRQTVAFEKWTDASVRLSKIPQLEKFVLDATRLPKIPNNLNNGVSAEVIKEAARQIVVAIAKYSKGNLSIEQITVDGGEDDMRILMREIKGLMSTKG